jgi:tetratricopeptide (TPR) repeat protein
MGSTVLHHSFPYRPFQGAEGRGTFSLASMFRLLRLSLFAFALLVGLTGVASAQAHEPPPEAMALFEQAREQYRLGQYEPAAENLERALVLDPSAPTLLFNLARVYELMSEFDRSISVYRRLLAVTPTEQTEERARTQSTIDRLEGAREHRVTPPPPTEEEERGPTFVRERGVADLTFWGILGAGAGVTVAAVVCGISAMVLFDQGSSFTLMYPGDEATRQSYFTDAANTGIATDVLGGIGAATILGAFLLFILRERTYESWDVTAHGGRIDLAFRFGDTL